MRHFEDYEIEHLLNSTGNFLLRFRCKLHLKKCPVCRKRLEKLQEDQIFIQQLRKGAEFLEQGQTALPAPHKDSSGETP